MSLCNPQYVIHGVSLYLLSGGPVLMTVVLWYLPHPLLEVLEVLRRPPDRQVIIQSVLHQHTSIQHRLIW